MPAFSDETFVIALCCVALLAGVCWGAAEIHARWFPDDEDE